LVCQSKDERLRGRANAPIPAIPPIPPMRRKPGTFFHVNNGIAVHACEDRQTSMVSELYK
jgi:hypothetical protein